MTERDDLNAPIDDEDEDSGSLRWMSILVVLVAVSGFVALAWYAYHTGTQSISEEDVALVTADETPVKEAPADPGGMQFPHQDKTVYDAISSTPKPKVTVERVLPSPEEPTKLAPMDAAQLTQAGTATPETQKREEIPASGGVPVPGPAVTPTEETQTATDTATAPLSSTEETPASSVAAPTPATMETRPQETVTIPSEPVATAKTEPKKEEAVKIEPKKVEAKKTETVKAEAKKPEPKKEAKAAPSAGGARVQLGAFKSDADAKAEWKKIAAKHSALNGKTPQVVRADLGDKGIFYRLQVAAGGTSDAKTLCQKLTAAGQGCLVK